MSDQYRTRVVKEVHAAQFTGENWAEIESWIGSGDAFFEIAIEDRSDNPDATAKLFVAANGIWAPMEPGEWIIRDSHGFYPCKPDIFAATYEAAATPHAPDAALGRCQALIQCHRETGHEGRHEAREETV
jgi:hypothetical protein